MEPGREQFRKQRFVANSIGGFENVREDQVFLRGAADQECEMTASRSPVGRRERNPYWQSHSKLSRLRNRKNW